MRKTFIEFVEFTAWVKSYLTDDALAAMQRELLVDPERGDVIPDCGGLRKLRVADPFLERMEKIWAGQRARGHVPRTREEIDAELRELRDDGLAEIEAAERLHEEC